MSKFEDYRKVEGGGDKIASSSWLIFLIFLFRLARRTEWLPSPGKIIGVRHHLSHMCHWLSASTVMGSVNGFLSGFGEDFSPTVFVFCLYFASVFRLSVHIFT